MQLNLIHKKPAAVHLYYPADAEAQKFLAIFNRGRAAKAFSTRQVAALKKQGIEVIIKQHIMEKDWDV